MLMWRTQKKDQNESDVPLFALCKKHGNAGHYWTLDILMKFGHFLIGKWSSIVTGALLIMQNNQIFIFLIIQPM